MRKHFLNTDEYDLQQSLNEIEKALTTGKGKKKSVKCFYEFHHIKNFIESAIEYKNTSPVAELERRLINLSEDQEKLQNIIDDLKPDSEEKW